MARIISATMELSGKAGGYVYARNRGGAYVRRFTIPINPRTLGQLAVRSAWASAVTTWHGLTNDQKAEWNNFATNFFKPKYPKIGVTYSGFNTYVSLKNELNQLVRVQTAGTFTDMTATATPWSNVITNPPTKAMASEIMYTPTGAPTTDLPISIRLASASIVLNDTTHTISMTFKLGNSLVTGDKLKFVDASSKVPVGIVVMQSYPMTQNNQFTLNPKYSFATAIEPITVSASTLVGAVLTVSSSFFIGDKKFRPKVGEVLELNGFLTSKDGLTQPIGTVKTTVAAS